MRKNSKLAMNPEALALLADRFKLLAKPIRLQILLELQSGKKSVSEIALAIKTTQPNVSKHLKVLLDGGILGREQDGNVVYYWVLEEETFELCDLVLGRLRDHLAKQAKALKSIKLHEET